MLISFGNSAQFGNAYLASAHRIAHALSTGYSLHLNDFGKYRDSLASVDFHGGIHIGGRGGTAVGSIYLKIVRYLLRRNQFRIGPLSILNDRGGEFPISKSELADRALSGLVIHGGWRFEDRGNLTLQASRVRDALAMNTEIISKAKDKIEYLKDDADAVIAVHVRRGDYKNFREGRYYFEDEVYLKLAAEAVAALGAHHQRIVVIGFSNERLDWPESLCGARVLTPAGTWQEDFLCLSMCDLIIGPPSTFSGAASFCGDVKWFQIKKKDTSFAPEKALTYLESGIQVQ